MNALEIKEYLCTNEDKLIELLEHLGCINIHKRTKDEFRCGYEEGSNPTGVSIKLNNNLSYTYYSKSESGDIFRLIRSKKGYTENEFGKSFKYLCDFLNLKGDFKKIEKPKIFGGLFEQFNKQSENNLSYEVKTYPITTLGRYELLGNDLFLKDGIDLTTQQKFCIGYDWNSNRIIIPEFSFEGELIGITGRYNGQDYEEWGEPKYYPIIEFKKSLTLYGYSQNYYELCNQNIFLVESQKSIMKMDSKGKHNFLALGGKALSDIQIKYIQNLNPKSVIVSLDSDATEEEAKELCNMLKPKSSFLRYKVGYVYDYNEEFLIKANKESICDFKDIKTMNKCVNKYIHWVFK